MCCGSRQGIDRCNWRAAGLFCSLKMSSPSAALVQCVNVCVHCTLSKAGPVYFKGCLAWVSPLFCCVFAFDPCSYIHRWGHCSASDAFLFVDTRLVLENALTFLTQPCTDSLLCNTFFLFLIHLLATLTHASWVQNQEVS